MRVVEFQRVRVRDVVVLDGDVGLDADLERRHAVFGREVGGGEDGDFGDELGHGHFDVEFDEVDALLAAVPDVVEANVPLRDLQARGDPDAVHGDVDGCDEHGDGNLEVHRFALGGEEDADAVDDDLEEKLDLQGPEGEDTKEKCEAILRR
ncbi:hypothetical protein DSL72_007317 [Monilinia vaccinii-corymbosi]|uniref:Uncharacterized protein n=1 Tax=Monilinia vaccinii-corymbosi TaxID=61207 RepID=A0A8A3PLB5_9HELO|nr:hypothetical protein DSL72_007317 [Monilinia vaccinii-corymbosi]